MLRKIMCWLKSDTHLNWLEYFIGLSVSALTALILKGLMK